MDPSQIQENLEQGAGYPVEVARWRVEVGLDSTGDPAVWVWATLASDNVGRTERAKLQDQVRDIVRTMSQAAPVWTYVRFRTESEGEE